MRVKKILVSARLVRSLGRGYNAHRSNKARFRLCVLLCAFCFAPRGFAQTSSFSVEPSDAVKFEDHDLGTETPRTLELRNQGTDALNITVSLSGDDSSEFQLKNTCPSNLSPGSVCEVTVVFEPRIIRSTTTREAQLTFTSGKGDSKAVKLTGGAYPNLHLSAAALHFDDQVVDKSSAPQTLTVTNFSTATLNDISATVTGDFTETHAKCSKIAPGASCVISVQFAPKIAGATSGSITITTDQSALGKLPRVVLLNGKAVTQCITPPISIRSWSFWLVALIGGLYFAGLVLVRWHMIAKPVRAQLVTQVNSVRAALRVASKAIATSPEVEARCAEIEYLLDWAVYPFKNKNFPVERGPDGKEKSYFPGFFPWYTRVFNAIFWPRGQELAGWSGSHEAELLLIDLLPEDRVRARMETAEQRLRLLNNPVATSVADRLNSATNSSVTPVPLGRWRALLGEAFNILYEYYDTKFYDLATWHGKMIWLVGSALLFIFALAASLQNAALLLMGAVGGLLSRLARTVTSSETANDYGATWGALFLSPLSGAISAWGGILLIVLGLKFNILGTALNVDWCNPFDPATLGIALLFGFSERLFDGLATQIEAKVVRADPTKSVPPAPAKPAPTITTIVPPSGTRGGPVQFTVTGTNFQAGAIATLADDHGTAIQATFQYQNPTTMQVTATFTGAAPFRATLTISNPDKQSASISFDVA